jgi:hypothetical protein
MPSELFFRLMRDGMETFAETAGKTATT